MEKIDTGGGFTLAELLIVVAIIAILVAIAIPMFTGAMEKSRAAVHRSNATTLKSIAIQELLTNPEKFEDSTLSASTWKVSGKYSFSDEEFSNVSIEEDTDFHEISAGRSKTNVEWLNGDKIGRVPTQGEVEYTVWVRRTDTSELLAGITG